MIENSETRALRPSEMFPSRTKKATSRISLAARFVGIYVGIQTFARPALPRQLVSLADQIRRKIRTLIAKDSTIYPCLLVHADKLSPNEQSALIFGQQYKFLAWAHDQVVITIPLPEKTDLITADPVRIVTAE